MVPLKAFIQAWANFCMHTRQDKVLIQISLCMIKQCLVLIENHSMRHAKLNSKSSLDVEPLNLSGNLMFQRESKFYHLHGPFASNATPMVDFKSSRLVSVFVVTNRLKASIILRNTHLSSLGQLFI
jgi:hypothetical protein